MRKIKMKHCHFEVDEAARTVVCSVKGDWVRDYALNYFKEQNINPIGAMVNPGNSKKMTNIIQMPDHFEGKAVCHEGDTWDVDTGRKIAFKKMKRKVIKSYFRHCQSAFNYISWLLCNLCDMADQMGAKFEDELERREADIEADFKRLGNISVSDSNK